MSRIPQSRTNTKTSSTPRGPSKVVTPSQSTLSVQSPGTPRVRTQSTLRTTTTAVSTPRIRTQSTSSRATTPSKQKSAEIPPPVPATPLSIREAIALKRAEAKKVQSKVAVTGEADESMSLEDTIPDAPKPEEEDLLGRMSVRDTIERARSTGKSQNAAPASC